MDKQGEIPVLKRRVSTVSRYKIMNQAASKGYFPSLLHGNFDRKSINENDVENFILNSVLPVSMAGATNHGSLNLLKEEEQMTRFSVRNHTNYEILTGSSAEGLCLPEVTVMKGSIKHKHFTYAADSDIKYVFTSLIVDNQNKRAFAFLDSSKSRPGFTRLLYNHEWQATRECKQGRFAESRERQILGSPESFIDNDGFILRRKITGILRKDMKDYIHDTDREIRLTKVSQGVVPEIKFSQHGPAITVDIADHVSKVMASKDYVLGFPCPRWPKEGDGWLLRSRVWPSMKHVKNIAKRGCHIVPKAHHASKDPCEFIISFSMTEKYVAHCLNVFQKRAYLLLKLIYKFLLNKPQRGLSTYHLKTTLFWLCERVPQDKWKEENPCECLHWLLSELEYYVKQRRIPNYFITSCNLLDHMTNESAKCILRNIQRIKSNLVQMVLQSTETYRFSWLSRDVSIADILQPTLTLEGIESSLLKSITQQMASDLLKKGEVHVAISILCGLTNCEILPPTERIIEQLEEILSVHSDEETAHVLAIQGLTAILYHQLAMEYCLASDWVQFSQYIEKSEQMFEYCRKKSGENLWIIAGFYNLLSTLDMHTELLRHFIANLHNRRASLNLYAEGIYSIISNHNWLTCDEIFYTQLDGGEFIVPSTAYILYKVFKSTVALADNSSRVRSASLYQLADKLIHDFEKWVKLKTSVYPEKIDENIYILLAVCGVRNDNNSLAMKYFQTAAQKGGPLNDIPDVVLYHETQLDKIKKLTKEELRTHPYQANRYRQRNGVCRPLRVSEFRYLRRSVKVSSYEHW